MRYRVLCPGWPLIANSNSDGRLFQTELRGKGTPTMIDRLVPIAEKAKMYLIPWRHGNDYRFAHLFQKAWNRIPPTRRFLLTLYWGHQGYAHSLVCGESHPAGAYSSSPRIELVSRWTDRDTILSPDDRSCDQGPVAEVFACGYLLRFCAPCIDSMAPDVVQDVVAHALARCWQYADSVLHRTRRKWDPINLEAEAQEIMREWGFTPENLSRPLSCPWDWDCAVHPVSEAIVVTSP